MVFEPGTPVWVPCQRQVWEGGTVVSSEEKESHGNIIVETASGQMIVVPAQPVAADRPAQCLRKVLVAGEAKGIQDLSSMVVLHEPEVLHALQERSESRSIYTYAGPMLLAVNPFRTVAGLYDVSHLRAYRDSSAHEESAAHISTAHIFGIAKRAFEGIVHKGQSQSILISGESGAGKTENTKFVMRFIAFAAGNVDGTEASSPGVAASSTEHRVLESIPLLESLGNAKTLRNNNSSRFGKYVELLFGRTPESPRILGVHTHTYLLEKVRVVSTHEGERSFHIFYQLLAAAARAEAAGGRSPGDPGVLRLGAGVELRGTAGPARVGDFAYLTQSSCSTLPDQDEAAAFDTTVSAMQAFKMPDAEISEVLGVIIAILHIGNVTFEAPKNNSEGSQVVSHEDGGPLAKFSALVGVKAALLEIALCRSELKVQDGGSSGTPRRRSITTHRTLAQAVDGRDALARHLYSAVFAFIVKRVNTVLSAQADVDGKHRRQASNAFIGVLDIFGFESFPENSFEQLCINFTNELLQQCFIEGIFKHEAKLYASESISWNPQDFPDNQAIIEILAGGSGGSGSLSGVFPMLDEECNIVGGTCEAWCRKLEKRYDASNLFRVNRFRASHFVIQHFAGPVEYNAEAFLVKNKDKLSAGLMECMKVSSSEFVRGLLLDHDRAFGARVGKETGKVTRAKVYSVSLEFREQLQSLMEKIGQTNANFVRCIKPNCESVPDSFDRKFVVEQLRYQGVLQAMQVSRAGYQVRLRHREAILQYWVLSPREQRQQLEGLMRCRNCAVVAQVLFDGLKASFGILDTSLQMGRTLVFFKTEAARELNTGVSRVRKAAALHLQATWRMIVCRRRFACVRRMAIQLQAVVRMLLSRRRAHILRRTRATLRLQGLARGHGTRKRWRRTLRAVRYLQQAVRVRNYRRAYLRLVHIVLRLQRWYRRTVKRVRRRRLRRMGICIQRIWRGVLGRRTALERRVTLVRREMVLQQLAHRWRNRVWERIYSELSNLPTEEEAQESIGTSCERRAAEAHLLRSQASLVLLEKRLTEETAVLEARARGLENARLRAQDENVKADSGNSVASQTDLFALESAPTFSACINPVEPRPPRLDDEAVHSGSRTKADNSPGVSFSSAAAYVNKMLCCTEEASERQRPTMLPEECLSPQFQAQTVWRADSPQRWDLDGASPRRPMSSRKGSVAAGSVEEAARFPPARTPGSGSGTPLGPEHGRPDAMKDGTACQANVRPELEHPPSSPRAQEWSLHPESPIDSPGTMRTPRPLHFRRPESPHPPGLYEGLDDRQFTKLRSPQSYPNSVRVPRNGDCGDAATETWSPFSSLAGSLAHSFTSVFVDLGLGTCTSRPYPKPEPPVESI